MIESTTRTAAQLVAEAKQRVENLTPEQVSTEIRDSQPLLVDLREPIERAQTGTIPGRDPGAARNARVLRRSVQPVPPPRAGPNRRVILYCASGGRSALAADVLMRMGYTKVAHLDGGLKAWQAAG